MEEIFFYSDRQYAFLTLPAHNLVRCGPNHTKVMAIEAEGRKQSTVVVVLCLEYRNIFIIMHQYRLASQT